MTNNETIFLGSKISVGSERELDNLASLRNMSQSTLNSPDNSGNRATLVGELHSNLQPGSSQPPHHKHRSSRQQELSYNRLPQDSQTSQWNMDMTNTITVEPDVEEMSMPEESKFESPVRKLRKKELFGEPEKDETMFPATPAPVERELSDTYIESISRIPRYERGKFQNYDEMVDNMDDADPFQGNYTPSGTKHHSHISSRHTKKRERDKQRRSSSQSIPMQSVRHGSQTELLPRKSKKKKHHFQSHPDECVESNATNIVKNQGQFNPNYEHDGSQRKQDKIEKASIKSNGTFTVSRSNSQSAVMENQSDIHPVQTSQSSGTVHQLNKYGSHLSTQMKKTQCGRDPEAIAKFIKKNKIIQRECSYFIQEHNKSKSKVPTIITCMCGRDLDWHEQKGLDTQHDEGKRIWHPARHTDRFPCDSFGEIQFQGFGNDTENSPYIRVCPTTDLNLMWEIMTVHWKLPIPKLLISVTGGAKRFDLKPRLKSIFKRGLVNAATSTGAWIITGGTATGVMEFVGEAVRDHIITSGNQDSSIVAIGVTTWGVVANRVELDGDGDVGLFPAVYALEDFDIQPGKKDVPLDHNHTHFILVDDGTENKFGKEITFRAELENFISSKVETGVAENQSVNVPVVLLVVQGGVNTMKTVMETVKQGIPVLVMKGSGQAADFIATGYQLCSSKNDDEIKFPSNFDEIITDVAKTGFEWKAADNIEQKVRECVHQLKSCLRKRKLINVYNVNEGDSKDIDRAILYALLKANRSNADAQLSLALAWNRSDIARQEIFTTANREHWKKLNLYNAMFTALVQDRVDFVQLFIDNGVDFKKFLTKETLWNLYANVIQDSTDSAAHLLCNFLMYLKQPWGAYLCCQPPEVQSDIPDLLLLVGKLIVHILKDEGLNPYLEAKYKVKESLEPSMKWIGMKEVLQAKTIGPKVSSVNKETLVSSRHPRRRKFWDFEVPEKELFLWAVILNRKDLAKLFWKLGKDQLGGALLACALLKALAKVASGDEEMELSLDLEEHSKTFETLAISVLSECYSRNKKMAHQLLVRKLKLYNNITLFSLADNHQMMDFMEHTCCQTKLNKIWKGKMAMYTSTNKIVLSILIPFFIPSIKFTSNASLINKREADILEDDMDITMPDDLEDIPTERNKVAPENDEDEIFTRSKSRRKKPTKKRLYEVQLMGGNEPNTIGLISALYHFYTAPVTNLFGNIISYLVFLGLFSYFVLTDFYPIDHANSPSVIEMITWGWTVSMIIEEVRQVLTREQQSLAYKLRSWISSIWNRFDLVMYLLFLMAVVLRFTVFDIDFIWARMMYSITISMYCIRFMQFFFVARNVGPKVIMIKNMLIDLWFFFLILVVFIISFGISYHANLFPNSPANWKLLKDVVYLPYWQMYGELFLDNMEAKEPSVCSTNRTVWHVLGTMDRCAEENALVPVLLAIYMILTNILLVNLLIAMFSYTFQNVQDNSEKVWCYYRFSLVYEYFDRPSIFPPFIILNHIYRVAKWVYCRFDINYHNEFKLVLEPKDNERLSLFERAAMENYLSLSQLVERQNLQNKVDTTAERIEKVIDELENIKEQVETQKLNKPDRPDIFETAESRTSIQISRMSSREIDNFQIRFDELTHQVSQQAVLMDRLFHLVENAISQEKIEVTTQSSQRPSTSEI